MQICLYSIDSQLVSRVIFVPRNLRSVLRNFVIQFNSLFLRADSTATRANYRVSTSVELPTLICWIATSLKVWPPRSPDLMSADFFLWGYWVEDQSIFAETFLAPSHRPRCTIQFNNENTLFRAEKILVAHTVFRLSLTIYKWYGTSADESAQSRPSDGTNSEEKKFAWTVLSLYSFFLFLLRTFPHYWGFSSTIQVFLITYNWHIR
jgi:hypothetical protein